MKTPLPGEVVLFRFESGPEKRPLVPALVLGQDGYGEEARLTLAFVDTIIAYYDSIRGSVGTITIVHDVPFVEAVRDSVDGSVMAACWMEWT